MVVVGPPFFLRVFMSVYLFRTTFGGIGVVDTFDVVDQSHDKFLFFYCEVTDHNCFFIIIA